MTATLIFTDHADYDNPEMIKALCYGTSDEKSKDYGKRGFIGHGLTFTKSVFAKTKEPFSEEKIKKLLTSYGKVPAVRNRYNWQVFDEERGLSRTVPGLDNPCFRKIMLKLSKDGIEVCPHCLSWESVSRDEARKLILLFKPFKPKTWIDHGKNYCKNSLAFEGAKESSPYYVLDLLKKQGYEYAWAYQEYPFRGKLNLKELDEKFIAYDQEKKLWLFKTIELKPSEVIFSKAYSPRNIDRFIETKGIHIAHVYFFQPVFEVPRKRFHFRGERFFWYIKDFFKWKILGLNYSRRKEIPNGVLIWVNDHYEIDPKFDLCLKYIGEKQKEGKIIVTTIKNFFRSKNERHS
ncbi:Uncharacterised protein [uncultured archaeon]|nr:Uncharacterised protein [uncultured archaeon]